jgi:hypothetical protein
MATLNPRITVTLTPAVYAVLREMSALTKNSQSAIVGDLLETSLPVFERIVLTLRAASTIEAEARTEIAAGMERAQANLEAQLDLSLHDFDTVSRPVLDEAEKVSRRGSRKGSTPVPVTRGSGRPGKPSVPLKRRAPNGRF